MKYYISHTKDLRWYVYKIGFGPVKYFDTQAEALEYQGIRNRRVLLPKDLRMKQA